MKISNQTTEKEFVIVFDAGAKGERYHNGTDYGTGDIYSSSVVVFETEQEANDYLSNNSDDIAGWVESRDKE